MKRFRISNLRLMRNGKEQELSTGVGVSEIVLGDTYILAFGMLHDVTILKRATLQVLGFCRNGVGGQDHIVEYAMLENSHMTCVVMLRQLSTMKIKKKCILEIPAGYQIEKIGWQGAFIMVITRPAELLFLPSTYCNSTDRVCWKLGSC